MATKLSKAQRDHVAEHLQTLIRHGNADEASLREVAAQARADGRENHAASIDSFASKHRFEADAFGACLALVMEAEVA